MCIVGTGEPSTPDQKDAVVELVTLLLERYPGAAVKGHRDFLATECPGFDVEEWWNAARA